MSNIPYALQYAFLFSILLSFNLSLAPPRSTAPLHRIVYHEDADDLVKRFMTPSSDSVLTLAQSAFESLNDGFFLTERDRAPTIDPSNRYRRLGANRSLEARLQGNASKIDRLLLPYPLAARFSIDGIVIREPVVSDHYMLAYRIRYIYAAGEKRRYGSAPHVVRASVLVIPPAFYTSVAV